MQEEKNSLWGNIHNKQNRIKNGSNEAMRSKGDAGAPTNKDFKSAAKTSKKK